jgi:hypothetical protein
MCYQSSDDDMISKYVYAIQSACFPMRVQEFPYSRAEYFTLFEDNFVVVDRTTTRTSPLTLVGAVVATLIQTQRRYHYNNTVAASFISMLEDTPSSSA